MRSLAMLVLTVVLRGCLVRDHRIAVLTTFLQYGFGAQFRELRVGPS
jgi:hypothetical protein